MAGVVVLQQGEILLLVSAILGAIIQPSTQQLAPPGGPLASPPGLSSPYQGAQLDASALSSPATSTNRQQLQRPQSLDLTSMTPQQLDALTPQQRFQVKQILIQQQQLQQLEMQLLQTQLPQTQQQLVPVVGKERMVVGFTGQNSPNPAYVISAANSPQLPLSQQNVLPKVSPPHTVHFPPTFQTSSQGSQNPPPTKPAAGSPPAGRQLPSQLQDFLGATGQVSAALPQPVNVPTRGGIPPIPIPPEIIAKMSRQQQEHVLWEHLQRVQQQRLQQQQLQRQAGRQNVPGQASLPLELRAFLLKQQQQQPPQQPQPARLNPQNLPGPTRLPPDLLAELLKNQNQGHQSPPQPSQPPSPRPPQSPRFVLPSPGRPRGGPRRMNLLPGAGVRGNHGVLWKMSALTKASTAPAAGSGAGSGSGSLGQSSSSGSVPAGVCPRLYQGEKCSARFHRCLEDSQCGVGAKCCPDACGRICKTAEPVHFSILPGSLLLPVCLNRNCAGTRWASSRGTQNECDAVKACGRDHKCCFDGCRNICQHKNARRQGAGLFGNLFGGGGGGGQNGGGEMDKNAMMLMMAAGGM